MRPRCGVAPSAGPPARPHPKLLGDGKGRRRGNSPLSHLAPRACRGAAWLRHDARPLWVTLGLQTAPSGPHEPPPRALTPPRAPHYCLEPQQDPPHSPGGSCADDSHPQPGCSALGGSHRFLGHGASISSPRAHPGAPSMGGPGVLTCPEPWGGGTGGQHRTQPRRSQPHAGPPQARKQRAA